MKALIIDDEITAIKNLESLIIKSCPLITSVVTTFPKEGLDAIKKEKPDILFLDIKMQGLNGFDLLESIDASRIDVVIVCGHSKYALKAIKLSVTDYLLKPVGITDLLKTVKKIEAKRQLRDQLEHQNKDFSAPTKNGKISINHKDGIQYVDIKELILVEAVGSYSKLFFANKTNMLVSKNLKQIEAVLVKLHFFRVHKSYMINLHNVEKYKPLKDGGMIYLTNGSEIELARTKKDEFNDLMEKYSVGKL